MRKLAAAVTIAGALAVAALVQGQGKTDPALNELASEFAAAFNAKDAAKVSAFYADDAVLMVPNQPMIKGRASIEAHWSRGMQEGATNLQLKPMESAVAGSQAFDAGTTTITVPGGQTENGKYVVVYKRVGADWKIAYDIYNSDSPPPAAKK